MTAPSINPHDIEKLLDDLSDPARLVTLLAGVCFEKADHLRANWQDEPRARAWERIAKRISQCADALEGIPNPYR